MDTLAYGRCSVRQARFDLSTVSDRGSNSCVHRDVKTVKSVLHKWKSIGL